MLTFPRNVVLFLDAVRRRLEGGKTTTRRTARIFRCARRR